MSWRTALSNVGHTVSQKAVSVAKSAADAARQRLARIAETPAPLPPPSPSNNVELPKGDTVMRERHPERLKQRAKPKPSHTEVWTPVPVPAVAPSCSQERGWFDRTFVVPVEQFCEWVRILIRRTLIAVGLLFMGVVALGLTVLIFEMVKAERIAARARVPFKYVVPPARSLPEDIATELPAPITNEMEMSHVQNSPTVVTGSESNPAPQIGDEPQLTLQPEKRASSPSSTTPQTAIAGSSSSYQPRTEPSRDESTNRPSGDSANRGQTDFGTPSMNGGTVHVKGHLRKNSDGTTTWVDGHDRKLPSSDSTRQPDAPKRSEYQPSPPYKESKPSASHKESAGEKAYEKMTGKEVVHRKDGSTYERSKRKK